LTILLSKTPPPGPPPRPPPKEGTPAAAKKSAMAPYGHKLIFIIKNEFMDPRPAWRSSWPSSSSGAGEENESESLPMLLSIDNEL
jgi:hypothetical protein